MLLEAFKLPPALREGYIVQWIRVISRRAVTLIKYAESETYAIPLLRPRRLLVAHSTLSNARTHTHSKRLNTSVLELEVMQRIREDLKLSADADFLVILGMAEKLSPGIYTTLAGDPLLMEERFIELFESFALS
jgi:hypothetical protein